MIDVTDEARSTRSDARAFADAFAEADDAFTFGPDLGVSRELSLAELGDVIRLDPPAARAKSRASEKSRRGLPTEALEKDQDDELLSLDELGAALTRPAREADVLDFDFGTSAHERARRRTAARLDASASARRRISGPVSRGAHPLLTDGRSTGSGRRLTSPRDSAAAEAGRVAMAEAASSVAERLAEPARGPRFVRQPSDASRAGGGIPTAPRPLSVPVDTPARRAAKSSPHGDAPRLREIERPQRPPRAAADLLGANPDRIAMWAVLLGILLVLIAFTSGSASAVALPLLAAL